MIPRSAAATILESLSYQAAVALVGPRQVGKTTLARDVGAQLPSKASTVYLDLESAADRAKLEDARSYLERHQNSLVILDEIHRAPGLFTELRGLIDEGRRRGQGTGRFLLLGSASLDLLRQAGETLAGRIAYVELGPLGVLEVAADGHEMERFWLRGGFPGSFTARDDFTSFRIRQDFLRSYLEREISQFSPRLPAVTLGRLWTMLAHAQGTLLNASRLGAALGVSTQSATRYVDFLVDLLLVRRLQPFHGNGTKRLVKTPKVYVRDSGLVHALLGLETLDELLGHPVAGASWEGFVLENLLGVAPERTEASFYRTSAGAEVDLVLDLPRGRRWVVEVKLGSTPILARGFHEACEDLQPEKRFVVYSGKERYPKTAEVEVISLAELAAELETA
jgi:predicted AAA+ superfamily ATPase